MIPRNRLISIVVFAALALCACGGSKAPIRTEPESRIVEYNMLGAQAHEKRDYERAARLYLEALNIALSIEKADSISLNALNAAASMRTMGKLDDADGLLEIILGHGPLEFPADRLCVAAYLRAAIYMDQGEADSALEWASRSLEYCVLGDIAEPAGVHVVMAWVSLARSMPEGAIAEARTALAMAPEGGVEHANALRVMAEARLSMGMVPEARDLFERALLMDKALGLPRRIALDMLGAGRALSAMGNHSDARLMFSRAMTVSAAGGLKELESRARTLLEGSEPVDKQ